MGDRGGGGVVLRLRPPLVGGPCDGGGVPPRSGVRRRSGVLRPGSRYIWYGGRAWASHQLSRAPEALRPLERIGEPHRNNRGRLSDEVSLLVRGSRTVAIPVIIVTRSRSGARRSSTYAPEAVGAGRESASRAAWHVGGPATSRSPPYWPKRGTWSGCPNTADTAAATSARRSPVVQSISSCAILSSGLGLVRLRPQAQSGLRPRGQLSCGCEAKESRLTPRSSPCRAPGTRS